MLQCISVAAAAVLIGRCGANYRALPTSQHD